MPIRKHFIKFYGKKWKEEIRPRILARAGDKCEECRKPNHAIVETMTGPRLMFWRLPPRLLQPVNPTGRAGPWTDNRGKEHRFLAIQPARWVYVVLTVAHLNHTPGHDDDDNLKALCQWCHLNYDKLHHAETRAIRKDAGRPILALATGAESKHA